MTMSQHLATGGAEPARTAVVAIGALRWNLTVRTVAQIVTWSITIIVARLLTPGDYGLMGMAEIVIGFCLLVNHLGAVPALVQQREIAPAMLRQTFALVLLSNAVLYAILFAASPFLALFLDEPRLTVIVRVLALGLLIGAFSAVPYALLQRDLNFKSVSLIEFAASCFGALTTLALVVAGNGVWGLVIGNLATLSGVSMGLLVLTRFRLLPRFRFAGFSPTLSFGLQFSSASILSYANRNLPGMIIGKTLGSIDLGYYSVMYDFAMLPLNKLMALTNQIAFAAYSRIQEDRFLVRRYFFESARVMLLVIFPLSWGAAAVAGDLIAVVLGSKWLSATLVLEVIAFGVPLRALDLNMNTLINGIGRPDIVLRNTLTGTLVIPPVLALGLPWGLVGVCVTAMLGHLLTSIINIRRSFAVLEARFGQLLLLYLPPVVSAGVMYVAVAGAQIALLDQLPVALRLGSAVAVGAAVYGLMTMLVNRDAALRALQLVTIRHPQPE